MTQLSLQDAQRALLPLSTSQRMKVFILENDPEVRRAKESGGTLPKGAKLFMQDEPVACFIRSGFPRPPVGPQPIDLQAKYLPVGRTKQDLRARLDAFSPSFQQCAVGFAASFAAAVVAIEMGIGKQHGAHEIALRASWLALGPVAAWTIAWPVIGDRVSGLKFSQQAVWPLIGINYGQIFDGLALRGPQVRQDTLEALPAYALICGLPLMLHFLPTPLAYTHGQKTASIFKGALGGLCAAAACSVLLGFMIQANKEGLIPSGVSNGNSTSHSAIHSLATVKSGCEIASGIGAVTLGARLLMLPRSSQARHQRITGFEATAFTILVAGAVGTGMLSKRLLA